ncbi:acyl-CoA N-acyltransferase [Neofusicoccum parvum]|uniref:Acyl-CoA N-acyltransferase n=1 Tax=Neofusicoccum parvum TaxID=310453 RepID=A0ACB5RX95_9PEZI|nr:acyl-CoA N-acyltransferase [Neofusicoccum parvum]
MRYRDMIQDDVPRVTDLAVSCFGPDKLWSWLYPRRNEHPDDLRRYMGLRVRQRLVEPGTRGIIAETEASDAEVAGFAFGARNGGDEAAKKWEADCPAHSNLPQPRGCPPSGKCRRRRNARIAEVERVLLRLHGWYYYQRFLDRATAWDRVQIFHESTAYEGFWRALDRETGSWHLAMLGVSAQQRRQGIGSSLVAWGKSRAGEEQVPATLEASAMGRALYAESSVRIVARSGICDGPEGVVMMWEPDECRGRWLETEAEDAKLRRPSREG